MTNTAKRTVLVTGAASGIGKASAELLARAGHRVFAGVRRPEAASLDKRIEVVKLDVTDAASVAACVAAISAKAGAIDVLVNNAGGALVGAVEETDVEQAQALFDVNVFGAIRVAKAVLPGMRAKGFGRIVNISSVLGFLPAPYFAAYSASKHALEGYSESLDHEVRGFGVRVIVIEPGFMRTNIDANSAKAAHPLPAYAGQSERAQANIGRQVETAPDPSLVAQAVAGAIAAPSFARMPVGPGAARLSRLRKWIPAKMFDSGLRKSFQL